MTAETALREIVALSRSIPRRALADGETPNPTSVALTKAEEIAILALHQRPETAQQHTAEICASDALRSVIEAWDALPRGNHSPRAVERWLSETIGPAIQAARPSLSALVRQPPDDWLTDIENAPKDGSAKLRSRAGSYDGLTRAYLKALGIDSPDTAGQGQDTSR